VTGTVLRKLEGHLGQGQGYSYIYCTCIGGAAHNTSSSSSSTSLGVGDCTAKNYNLCKRSYFCVCTKIGV
jgi:hypothetical protein